MEILIIIGCVFLGAILVGIIKGLTQTPEQRRAEALRQHVETFGQINASMICPHCEARGTVRTKHVKQKQGISGGKATAAVLTGGISMLATGLSRKENLTQAHCDGCNNTWAF